MPKRASATALAISLISVIALGACDLVARYAAGSEEDRLVQAVLDSWAAPGRPFLEGASGRDTVASVSATGARSWEVAVVPPSGGTPVVWALEVTRVEIYEVFPGEVFVRWLNSQARDLGMTTFLPPDVSGAIQRGGIRAVGDVEARFGSTDRSGRNTVERVAYLQSAGDAGDDAWKVQPETRSSGVLLRALKTVAEDMLHRDDRVLSCMGSASPARVPRSVQLECVAKVLDQEFGEGR